MQLKSLTPNGWMDFEIPIPGEAFLHPDHKQGLTVAQEGFPYQIHLLLVVVVVAVVVVAVVVVVSSCCYHCSCGTNPVSTQVFSFKVNPRNHSVLHFPCITWPNLKSPGKTDGYLAIRDLFWDGENVTRTQRLRY